MYRGFCRSDGGVRGEKELTSGALCWERCQLSLSLLLAVDTTKHDPTLACKWFASVAQRWPRYPIQSRDYVGRWVVVHKLTKTNIFRVGRISPGPALISVALPRPRSTLGVQESSSPFYIYTRKKKETMPAIEPTEHFVLSHVTMAWWVDRPLLSTRVVGSISSVVTASCVKKASKVVHFPL